jgi:YegS/Rv2252/BmrU family lipid kinase
MQDWLIIVNPNAGCKQGLRDWNSIEKEVQKFNINGEVCFTKAKYDAIEIVKEFANKGYRKIIAVGGDGTVNEIVNGIYAFSEKLVDEFTLGVIPIGTGNDWCKMFNIPNDYHKAVEIISVGKEMLQDVGFVEYKEDSKSINRYFVNVAGLGFDAEVLKKSNEEKEKGKFGKFLYFKNLFANLMKFSYLKTELIFNGENRNVNLFSMNLGICKYSGNGMMQVPNAIADDGLFDVTIIKKMSKFDVLKNVKNLYDGSFVKHKQVEVHRTDKITINGTEKLRLEVDGEYIGIAPFQFSIQQKALRIIVNN